METIVTVIGARPQIIKAAALSRAIRNNYSDRINEIIVHTGQHYSDNMSGVFFDELQIPVPKINLNVGSASHGIQISKMITGLEAVLEEINPDYVVLYGDTNSTLAGALAASKIHIPIVHIEAGLRSYNKQMPEEINRILCDHVSTFLFTPTVSGLNNLIREGFRVDNQPVYHASNPGVFHCGDVMYDNFLHYSSIAERRSMVLKEHGLLANKFILATIHRDHNTDISENLRNIFAALREIAHIEGAQVVLPLHPRTQKCMEKYFSSSFYHEINKDKLLQLIPPVSFLDMIQLEKNAKMIVTDSGGVQKEAYFSKKPCIILREQTEWLEILETGSALLAGANYNRIMEAHQRLSSIDGVNYKPLYGLGNAAEFICEKILCNKP